MLRLCVCAGKPFKGKRCLGERFDTVKFCMFQRKSANFRELVLFCIEADFCNQIVDFFSIFQDLQDKQTFAPLPIQNIRKNSSNFFEFLFEFLQKTMIFRQFSSKIDKFLMIFSLDFAEYSRKC